MGQQIGQFFIHIRQIPGSAKKIKSKLLCETSNLGAESSRNISGECGLVERKEKGHRMIVSPGGGIYYNKYLILEKKILLYTKKSPSNWEAEQLEMKLITYPIIDQNYIQCIYTILYTAISPKISLSMDGATNHNWRYA